MYKYWGFGLNIASEIAMPELLPTEFDSPDVTISNGKVPESIDGVNVQKRRFSQLSETEYILEVRNICRYYAGNGSTIIIEPCTTIEEQSIRLFLLGTVIAAILYQRGNIPLHASALLKDGKLTLFTGNSGAGKSTLLASLLKKGYTVFTDDICVINQDPDTNLINGTASYPMIKLWEDSINKIAYGPFNKDFKIRPQLPKFGQFFHSTFYTSSFPIEKVFILQINSETNEISYRKINTIQAFKSVEQQAYRYRFTTGDKLRPLHFKLMSSLAGSVPVIEMKRPLSGTKIEDFSNLVESLL